MTRSRVSNVLLVLASVVLIATCSREDLSDTVDEVEKQVVEPVLGTDVATPSLSDEEEAAAAARVQLLTDSADRQLRRVKALSMVEKVKLRRDANAEQIAVARRLGLRPHNLEDAIARKKLVELADSTALWALHDFDFSVPYVTPSTHVLLTEIAQRFQTRLDSAAVPRFRIVITSALRTPEKQAALRRVNSNASRVESAHEFGTTVDIAYRRFAAPYDVASIPSDTVQTLVDSVLVKQANLRSAELQAVLGRVLLEMKQEGKVMVMMEKRQTVYHITVARHLEAADPPSARR
jgi:hypothetical protein